MDEWEQHFVEKSRRRFEKERYQRRRNGTKLIVAAVVLAIIVAGAILGLTAWA